METRIRRAVAADAPALTQMMHASSAYRGDYGRILDAYVVTPEQVERDLVFLAEDLGQLLGFYSLTFATDQNSTSCS